MKLCIAGIDHRVQCIERSGRFEAVLSAVATEESVDLIAEEAAYEGPDTIAKLYGHASGIEWINMDMTREERQEANLQNVQNYCITGAALIHCESYPVEYSSRREAHWVRKVLSYVPVPQSVLVICGLAHVSSLAQRFSDLGYKVLAIKLENTCDPIFIQRS